MPSLVSHLRDFFEDRDLICLRGLVGSEFALDMNERLANITADYESATVVYSTFRE
jgi:hypothetical protein